MCNSYTPWIFIVLIASSNLYCHWLLFPDILCTGIKKSIVVILITMFSCMFFDSSGSDFFIGFQHQVYEVSPCKISLQDSTKEILVFITYIEGPNRAHSYDGRRRFTESYCGFTYIYLL